MKILAPVLITLTLGFAFAGERISDIAAHNPQVQKTKENYRIAEGRDASLAAYNGILKLQKSHREIYDKLKVGDTVFVEHGLITLGEIRYDDEEQGYRLIFGFKPREAGENAAGVTELIVHFDDSGLITKKIIPKYKW